MKTSLRTAILIFSAVPLVAASTSFGRDLRPLLIATGPAKVTSIAAPIALAPVATTALLLVRPIVAPLVLTPVAATTLFLAKPIAIATVSPVEISSPIVTKPSAVIFPTTPIIYPTTPLSIK